MPFVYGDRVKETSLTTGTGALALGGPTVGFQSFAVGVGVSNETFYGVVNTADDSWEMGRGTVGPGSLSRDTVISSSNSNLPVNFISGQKVVYTTVPSQFYAGALDAAAHEAIDHTAAPLNLMTTGVHDGIDHTAAPFSLLSIANLPAEHALIDHLSAPFNLLDGPAHDAIDHRDPPFNLLTDALHTSINHFGVITAALPQVSSPEKTAGTEVGLRTFSPLDVADMAGIHGAGAAGGKIAQVQYTQVTALDTFSVVVPGQETPLTDALPTSSQGRQLMTVVITPTNAASTLLFEIIVCQNTNIGTVNVALYKDADVVARASTFFAGAGPNNMVVHTLRHEEPAASTSPQTWRVRYSGDVLGVQNITINGRLLGRVGGGSQKSSITVSEITP